MIQKKKIKRIQERDEMSSVENRAVLTPQPPAAGYGRRCPCREAWNS